MGLFPVDIFAVKKHGVAKWQRDFFWPISDQEFVSLYDGIEWVWRDLITTSRPATSSVLLHARALPIELCHFLQAIQVIERVRNRGLHPVCSSSTRWYSRLLNHPSEKGQIGVSRVTKKRGHMIKKVLLWGKKRVREMQCNVFHALPNPARNSGRVCVFGAPQGMVKKYLRKLPNWITVTYPADWIDGIQRIDTSPMFHRELQETTKKFFEALRGIAARHSISLSRNDEAYLLSTIENEVEKSARLLEQVREKMRSRTITHFVAPNLRSPIPCAIAIVVKEQGGRVTSFTHGGLIGLFRSPTMSMSEFAISDEFVMYTKGCGSLFEKILSHKPPPFNNQVRFVSGDSEFYYHLWRAHEKEQTPRSVRKVMLIGCPQNIWRKPQASASLGFMQLDFELQVCDLLHQAGYEVLYKAHPDRRKEIDGIFDKKATIVTGYLEEAMHLPDAIVFGGIRTSAFPVAICTNKPIIAFMLDKEFPPPFPEAMELLKKRCQFIYTHFDAKNRIEFDRRNLLRALERTPSMPDMEFAHTYLFP